MNTSPCRPWLPFIFCTFLVTRRTLLWTHPWPSMGTESGPKWPENDPNDRFSYCQLWHTKICHWITSYIPFVRTNFVFFGPNAGKKWPENCPNMWNHKWNTWMVFCLQELMQCALSTSPSVEIWNHRWNTWVLCSHELLLVAICTVIFCFVEELYSQMEQANGFLSSWFDAMRALS